MKVTKVFDCASAEFCQIRATLKNFLQPLGFSSKEIGLMILAVDEACANILRHAYGGESRGPLTLTLESKPRTFRVTLRDYGVPCEVSKIRSRSLEDVRPGGLGVFLIHQAFESVRYQPLKNGTRLVLTKKLPSARQKADSRQGGLLKKRYPA